MPGKLASKPHTSVMKRSLFIPLAEAGGHDLQYISLYDKVYKTRQRIAVLENPLDYQYMAMFVCQLMVAGGREGGGMLK